MLAYTTLAANCGPHFEALLVKLDRVEPIHTLHTSLNIIYNINQHLNRCKNQFGEEKTKIGWAVRQDSKDPTDQHQQRFRRDKTSSQDDLKNVYITRNCQLPGEKRKRMREATEITLESYVGSVMEWSLGGGHVDWSLQNPNTRH